MRLFGYLIVFLLVLSICGMAIHVTKADNECSTEIDWVGRCLP